MQPVSRIESVFDVEGGHQTLFFGSSSHRDFYSACSKVFNAHDRAYQGLSLSDFVLLRSQCTRPACGHLAYLAHRQHDFFQYLAYGI